MGKTVRGPAKVKAAQRRSRVAELRRNRWTLDEIAGELGVHVKTVQRDLDTILEELQARSQTDLDVWRHAETDDLLRARRMAFTIVEADPTCHAALSQVSRTAERIAKLWGLDAPLLIETETSILGSLTDLDAVAALASLPASTLAQFGLTRI